MTTVQIGPYTGTDAPACFSCWSYQPVSSRAAIAKVEVLRVNFHGSRDWDLEVAYRQNEKIQLSLEEENALHYLFSRKVSKHDWLKMLERGYLVLLH